MLRTVKRGAVPLLCCLATSLLTVPSPSADAATAAAHDGSGSSRQLWATQFQFDDNGTPWSVAMFRSIKAEGVDEAEFNMPWSTIEPAEGMFDFGELDQELANAAAAGVKIVPIFWQSGWGGSPASWITDFERDSSGAQGDAPAWWDAGEQDAYFQYVTATVAHIAHDPGFGGAILNYGRLDAQWDMPGNGFGGWAPADIAFFQHTWLPRTYGTIARFDTANGTTYTDFSQVPAAASGPLASVYQAFRLWSVQDTYGRLTAAVRRITGGPLYYYFGGHISNAPQYGNLPEVFFQLARRYDVSIIEDAAASPGLSLLFGSLARAYHVPVAQEWTPTTEDLYPAEAAQWMANYGMTAPYGGGEDFFIHDGTDKDVVGWPLYTGWLPQLKAISQAGSYPTQPVAVYYDDSQAEGNADGGDLSAIENEITSIWNGYQAGFAVVTSSEVADQAARLDRYRAVLPLNGTDANVTAYQQDGGTVLASAAQLSQSAPAYAVLSSAYALQTTPVTAADRKSSTVTLAEVNAAFPYDGSVTLNPAGLDLVPGTYHIVDAVTGAVPSQTTLSDGGICAPVHLASAALDQWNVVPGPAPAGTPVPAACPDTGGGPATVTGTAGVSGGGIEFLDVGATGLGGDGNLYSVTQGGQAAYETWPNTQTGVSPANVYLQIDPSSQVYTASTVAVAVTYWSVAGQGFTVQYDAPGDAYLNGPSVTGSGTGSWQSATVTLTDPQFGEAQNLGADLRLAVADPSQPLYVSSVTMSVAGS
ncbi:beta-galactosidase [Actinospica durhamensis]|uniref:Beta-galactosidase n=1 Tax=Actinospica durhamensis TaxID=1508375 RepID=A0A941IQS8_9ACTN|nr:beta-galactosidase [Actinospica durhamensis]MBR7836594.1 beta-galactosidase [Actinospica durhamensis]